MLLLFQGNSGPRGQDGLRGEPGTKVSYSTSFGVFPLRKVRKQYPAPLILRNDTE